MISRIFRSLIVSLVAGLAFTASRVYAQSSICYSKPGGSDSNDGSFWAFAKADVMACYDALPPAGGTIYIMGGGKAGEGIPACKVDDPHGCGIWIMGRNDPNYTHPPAGWRRGQGKAVSFIGVGVNNMSQQGSAPQVSILAGSSTTPGIWLSSSTTSVSFENIAMAYPNPSVQIGVDSNGNNTGASGWIGANFKNVATQDCNACPSTNGPGWFIGGGNSFDIFIEHSIIQGNPNAIPGTDNQAAILVRPPNTVGSGDGLIDIRNSVVSGGGIKFYSGNNPSSLTVDNVYSENINGGSLSPGVGTVWLATGLVAATIKDVTTADARGNVCDVRNDAPVSSQDPAWVTVLGGTGTSGTGVCGPAAIIAPMPTQMVESPLRQGQEGFDSGRVIGFSGNAQRQLGLYTPRFPNLAASLPTSWSIFGAGLLTKGIIAPDGTANAGQGGRGAGAIIFYDGVSVPLTVGDYFIASVWLRSTTGGYGPGAGLIIANNVRNTLACTSLGTPFAGDGEWEYESEICKVTAVGINPGEIRNSVPFSSKLAIQAYAPVLIHIPAGTVSDNEAYEIWNNLASYSNTCPVGAMCGLPDKPVIASAFGTLSNCTSSASPAACGSAAAGSVTVPTGSASVVVDTSEVTGSSQINLTFDSSLGSKLHVICNETAQQPYVSARIPGGSFTISVPNRFTTNPGCISYSITN
jgi:hypothetical protein